MYSEQRNYQMKNRLKNYQSLCVALGKLFPHHMEIILHDLTSGKIAYIENSFSNRIVGDDSLIKLEELDADADENGVIGTYPKTNFDGTQLKSVSSIIRDDKQNAIALMCINFKVEEINTAIDVLSRLITISSTPRTSAIPSLMAEDWREQVNVIIRHTLEERQIKLISAKRQDKLAILAAIDKADIFSVRGSSNYVADALGISRANLYEILRNIRK